MQLTGPPRVNDYVCPYPVKDEPLDGRWTDEREDQGRVLRDLDGKRKYIGPRQWRGRWTVTWDAITYEVAQRILYEVGAAQRLGQGVGGGQIGDDGFVQPGDFLWTPRTSQTGSEINPIDVDGDGLVDVILQEVKIPCILTRQPSTTPLYRKDGGTRIVRMQLEFESTETYQERAGFGFPPTISFRASGQTGDEVDVEMLDSTGSLTDRVAQVRVRKDGSTIDTFALADFPYSLPEAGDFGFALVAAPDFAQIAETLIAGPVEISTIALGELTDTDALTVRPTSSGSPSGTADESFYPPTIASSLVLRGSGTYSAADIPPDPADRTEIPDQSIDGAIADLPSSEVVDVSQSTLSDTTAPPSSWWDGGVQELYHLAGNANVDLDEAKEGDTGIRVIDCKGSGPGVVGALRPFLENVGTFEVLKSSAQSGATALGEDLSGAGVIHSNVERLASVAFDRNTTPYSDWSAGNNLVVIGIYSIDPLGVDRPEQLSCASQPLDTAVDSPSTLSETDGLIGALEAGVDLSGCSIVLDRSFGSEAGRLHSIMTIAASLYDQITSYAAHPSLLLRRADRPRTITAVDPAPASGDIAIEVDDASATMHDLLGTQDATGRVYQILRIRYSGGIDGRWEYEGTKSRPDSSTTRVHLVQDVGGGTSSTLDQHSTALLQTGDPQP